MNSDKLLLDIILVKPIDKDKIADKEYMAEVQNSSKIESIRLEDMGIKFQMSQLMQLLRSRLRVNDVVPESTFVLYLKDEYAYLLEIVYNQDILSSILYYEVRINDMFDILDDAGDEIREFIEENKE